MTEKPILFKPEMVKAILEGRKTQTRRVVKPQPHSSLVQSELPSTLWQWLEEDGTYHICPYGQVGDRLWVKETICHGILDPNYMAYKADDVIVKQQDLSWPSLDEKKTIPSIHMPRWAIRLMLEITDVRVERVQDIAEEDAIAEGLQMPNEEQDMRWNPMQAFQLLWQSIHKNDEHDWDANPWVWVIVFTVMAP